MNRRSGKGRRQTKNSERTGDEAGGDNSDNDSLDLDMELDLIQQKNRKRYPIIPLKAKELNTHNLAEIPSLKPEEDNGLNIDNGSQSNDDYKYSRMKFAKRTNANTLIESRNRFRQLLGQSKYKSSSSYNVPKNDNNFDGYELKSRKVKYDSKKHKKDSEAIALASSSKSDCEFSVYGRKIDLSGFLTRNSSRFIPMYPVCRQWAMSGYGIPDSLVRKPRPVMPPMKEDTVDPDGPYSDGPIDVNYLPPCLPLPVNDNGDPICLRIPQFVREFVPPKNLNVENIVDALPESTREELLKLNQPRWKKVRQEFLDAAKINGKRYAHSFEVLSSMYKKAEKVNGDSKNKNIDTEVEKDTKEDLKFFKYPPFEPFEI